MLENPLSWMYFPTAVILGALHALEPGHAKTLTAAYLIGIKGTKKDAFLLGLSVAFTHSIVVVGISALALWIGKESFTNNVTHHLQIGSGVIVIALGFWMLYRRLKRTWTLSNNHHHHHHPNDDHGHHGHHHAHHDSLSDDEHAKAHERDLPEYVNRGERPTPLQIMLFGAAGGMIPCPASITVMLLALSIGKFGLGLFAVSGFSLGLALTLVGIGLLIVAGISKLDQGSGRLHHLSAKAPIISAAVVILSGFAALIFAH